MYNINGGRALHPAERSIPMARQKFIPREKMSKKARKELDRQGRVVWAHSPVSKVFESKKAYNRRNRDWLKEDGSDRGFCFFFTEKSCGIMGF